MKIFQLATIFNSGSGEHNLQKFQASSEKHTTKGCQFHSACNNEKL